MELEADFSQICLPTFSFLVISTSAITQPSWPRLLLEPVEGSKVTLPQVHLIFTSPQSGLNCGLPAPCSQRYLSANSPFLSPSAVTSTKKKEKDGLPGVRGGGGGGGGSGGGVYGRVYYRTAAANTPGTLF